MTPEPDPDFAAACRLRWPGFRATGSLPARKSQLLVGELDGVRVVAKRLARPNAVWAWYLARELAIYRAFAATPPPFRAPRLVAATDDILVVEHVSGEPLARRRRPAAELTPDQLAALLATCAQIAAWSGTWPEGPVAPPAVHRALRRRLLEDATAPVAWVREGVARGAATGILDDAQAAAIDGALALEVAPSHGDLLLRHAIGDGDAITLVDWECAGPHLALWDRALLWTQLGDDAREQLERRVGAGELRALVALAAFALVREIAIVRAFNASDDALVRALTATVARL